MFKSAKESLAKDLEFKIDATNLGKDIEEAFRNSGGLMKKDIGKAFGKFDAKVISRFSNEQLKEYGPNATAAQWRELDRSNKTTQYNIILEAKENRLRVAGIPTEEKTKLVKQIEKMKGLLTGENR